MVESTAPTVETYLSQASRERAQDLNKIRELARRVLRNHEERMQWGMPAYVREGRVSFGFAERKQFLSLYFVNAAALQKNAEALGGVSRGKGCIRFRKSMAIDWKLLEKLLVDTRESEMDA